MSEAATEFVPKQNDWYKLSISKEELIELQKLDISLEPFFKQVGKGKLGKKIEFVLREGILCRMSSDVQAQIDTLPGEVVVPKQLRNHILKMAHDIPISGHDGMD